MTKRNCKTCSSEFESGHYRAYCSDKCRRKWRADRAREASKTPQYREWYEARRAAGVYAEKSRVARDARRVIRSTACRYCGVGLSVPSGSRQVICGAPDCRYHYNRDKTSLGLARRSGVPIGPAFSYLDVLARDSWTCGICGEEIDPAARYPSKQCATVDHIVPLSRGGAHDMSNVQAAHFGCNTRKSDSLATL